MEMEQLSIDELKRGYRFDAESRSYICNFCRKRFEAGEIFPIENRFFDAARAIQIHADTEHGDRLKRLLYAESKYNAFTDNQKELLFLIYSGLSDKEIATKLGISAATVRHQRFTFREKAKQAKMYLAIYEQVMEKKSPDEEAILPVHSHATMVDERYIITEKEKERILKTVFESLSPLKLKSFPPKEKKKLVILAKITELFEYGRTYSEKEINEIIGGVYDDFAVIRRYLVDYGFMARTADGKQYWLK
ncbi:transcriptional regulator [Paenibacillus cisolokensis]|uniref:Transcriptional regulator n=1 Tax=Paenibacillus cisolokensis TaxID=1658519 RepID=A0ABQ4NBA7_9BACL|nr:DUF2087 domain-containing protein [Paenibacillus cisolokensis]GIQ65520.1 transcriptional regulator [Paenibacillus cisolokensis]